MPGINRNIVECKGITQSSKQSAFIVLIETLWNVKQNTIIVLLLLYWVLIETLWNVKIEFKNWEQTKNYRINRNIVECKDINSL